MSTVSHAGAAVTRRRSRVGASQIARPVVAGLISIVVVSPLIIMVLQSLQTDSGEWTLENLRFALTDSQVFRWLLNSVIVSVSSTALVLVIHSLAGYALARLRFRGREMVFLGVAATMFVSLPVVLVPLFVIVREMGLLDTYVGIVVPTLFGGFATILMRQFFLTVPRELEEAARIDGCGHFQTFLRVFLPIAKPAFVSVAVINFLASWNLFMWPLTITSDSRLWVVQVGITSFQTQYQGSWGYMMAVTFLSALPTLIVFFILQRYIVASLKTSGIK
ncbi:carbohydrate ABC transporter permease [Microbacterium sp. CIAB417]|uniref:carbohydrate ABC transporter permease n=1 Tax=Microbacterium sp. CIAB417 TaxID=2860287 RepID=UPI001FADC233|nr:carbohydrate ABC transporter permease [Microbacterium sp. CIAB417]